MSQHPPRTTTTDTLFPYTALDRSRTIENRSVIGAIVGRSTVRRSATRAMTGVTTGSPGPTGAKAGRTIVRHPAIGGTLGRMTVGIGETIAPMTGANGATVAPTVAWSRTAEIGRAHV